MHVAHDRPAGRHVVGTEATDQHGREDRPARHLVPELHRRRPADAHKVSNRGKIRPPCLSTSSLPCDSWTKEHHQRKKHLDAGSDHGPDGGPWQTEGRHAGNAGKPQCREAILSEDQDVVGDDVDDVRHQGGGSDDPGTLVSEEPVTHALPAEEQDAPDQQDGRVLHLEAHELWGVPREPEHGRKEEGPGKEQQQPREDPEPQSGPSVAGGLRRPPGPDVLGDEGVDDREHAEDQ